MSLQAPIKETEHKAIKPVEEKEYPEWMEANDRWLEDFLTAFNAKQQRGS